MALAARAAGVTETPVDDFAFKALFATLTNVNFDPDALTALQQACMERTRELARAAGHPRTAGGLEDLHRRSATGTDTLSDNEDVRSAMQLLLYGLKGVAAYADHAGRAWTARPPPWPPSCTGAWWPARRWTRTLPDLNGWVELLMECGKTNLRAMELLEEGNTGTFGHPSPTPVSLGQRKGKAILVSGHDLADLAALLEQTAGTGIHVYTHGEMLARAHGYPALRAHAHLAGHYGTAWQNQRRSCPPSPGAVLFTTNCIQDPRGYADKVFTSGNVGWPG